MCFQAQPMRHKGSRTGQRKKVNYNAAATETSTSQHKVEGAPELGWLFRAAPN